MIIPFFIPHAGCPHRCVFCDQRSISGRRTAQDPSSIPSFIDQYLGTRTDEGQAEVAFYGGSFTALPEALQRSYLEAVQPFLDSGAVTGIRLSTRPDAITPDRVAGAVGNRGDWSPVTGTGILNNGAPDDCVATYSFGAGEASVVLGLRNTHVQTVNIDVVDGNAIGESSGTGGSHPDADLSFAQAIVLLGDGLYIAAIDPQGK